MTVRYEITTKVMKKFLDTITEIQRMRIQPM